MNKLSDKVQLLRSRERRKELKSFITASSNKLSLPLYLIFIGADYLFAPNQLVTFVGIRTLIVPACLLVNYLIKKAKTEKTIQFIGVFYVFVNAILITILAFMVDGKSSAYYAGLNLCAISVGSFIPWTKGFLVLNFLIIYAPFYLLSAIHWNEPGNSQLGVNSFFMVSTVVIVLVIRFFHMRSKLYAIRRKIRLDTEILRRDEIIKKKTDESIRLSSLAEQFSPQIVKSIMDGTLEIRTPTGESPVCVLEVDISGSTAGLVRIGASAYDQIVGEFHKKVLSILFRYDLTFDKYIGDAILAFCNEPVKYTDYTFRVVIAACEIIKSIEEHQEYYSKIWKGQFAAKIGIASGSAIVGFKGEGVKAYTATGPCVNLACRMCSDAKAGQIFASEEVIENIRMYEFSFQPFKEEIYKGFETLPKTNVFLISGSAEITRSSYICPNKCGSLYMGEDENGIHVFKCRVCNFVMKS